MKWISSLFLALGFSVFVKTSMANQLEVPELKLEFAVSVCERNEALETKLSLSSNQARRGQVIYFDSPTRVFYKNGLILRLRVKEDKADLTVKIRPIQKNRIKPEYFKVNGFKCEWDTNRNKSVLACSNKIDLSLFEARKILSSRDELLDAIDDSQWMLAGLKSNSQLPWSELESVGPAEVRRWKKIDFGGSDEIEVQSWKLQNGESISEVSFRSKLKKFGKVKKEVLTYLLEQDVQLCAKDFGKTKQVLDIK